MGFTVLLKAYHYLVWLISKIPSFLELFRKITVDTIISMTKGVASFFLWTKTRLLSNLNTLIKVYDYIVWFIGKIPGILDIFRKVAVDAIISIVIILLLTYAVKEIFFSRVVIIEPFDVPATLVGKGQSPEALAKIVIDRINTLKAKMQPYYRDPIGPDFMPGPITAEPDFEIPQTRITINSFVNIVRRFVGKAPKQISGTIVMDGGKLVITI